MISKLRKFAAVAVSAAAMTMLSGGLPLIAQEPGTAKVETRAKAKRAVDLTRRVPNYFGQLGLSNEQKESIYKIQAKHMPKIDALEQQIDDLRAAMIKDCETVLTAPQKQQLVERRAAGAEARSKRAAAPAPKTQG